jgi:pimeloyl-ACP methyl ester carboxylesterase
MISCYGDVPLDAAIRSRMLPNGNGLSMHILEAGYGFTERPLLLLLHGFPELAYSWRKIMPALASAGFHVVAPDQRGYGRTLGSDDRYDGDLASFRLTNLVRDIKGLVIALGRQQVAGVIGHDFGSPVAAWCALLNPEIFQSVALLSAPFPGPPRPRKQPSPDIQGSLAALTPPRKHYQHYYCGRDADANMRFAPDGLGAFLRAYFHCKSADWQGNQPALLQSWDAEELARMPRYYIMDLNAGMAATAAAMAPSAAQAAACEWLSDAELAVFAEEFSRRSFQGGLQWYRNGFDAGALSELESHSGAIQVPACFIAGKRDWGSYQSPGALQAMPAACAQFDGVHLIDAAGHWVQQEQPAALTDRLLKFLRR